MSFSALNWACSIRDASVCAGARHVLLTLAQYADEDETCFPSLATLAAITNLSEDTVQRRIKNLVEHELIFVVRRKHTDGRRLTNYYCLLVDERARRHAIANGWAPADTAETRSEDRTEDVSDEPIHTATCGVDQTAGETKPHRRGNETTPHSCGVEPLTNHQITNPPTPQRGEGEGEKTSLSETTNVDGSASLRRCGSGEVDEDGARLVRWEKFRRTWPWDATEKPEEARRRFMELENGEQLAAVASAPRYIEACVQRERKISHAKTWLSGKGWQVFDAPSQSASARVEAERQRLAEAKAKTHEIQRQKYGGIIVRKGTPQAAAWARHDGEPLKFRRVGAWDDSIVKPSEWPPSASHGEAPRDGPSHSETRV
ncbi:MAG: helix-turn-helix domain-containing protein [Alphaproteobacteria bacterium]|nr:helix-turn-helix domain-containing protein [Alphaproteobacteria bacterium]